jgi:hypothetical protein
LPIFEHNRDQFPSLNYSVPNQFLPIAKSVLHAQRVNLYHEIRLRTTTGISLFCRTISSNAALGAIVNTLVCQDVIVPYVYGWVKQLFDTEAKLCSIFHHFTSLRTLLSEPELLHRLPLTTPIDNAILTVPTLTTLNSLGYDYSLSRSILDLFPQIRNVTIHNRSGSPPVIKSLESILRIPMAPFATPLTPARQLDYLHIDGNFFAPSLQHLVASTIAGVTILSGRTLHLATQLFINSEHRKRLKLFSIGPTPILDNHLLELTHLTHLTLGNNISVGNSFFTNFFPSSSLHSLELQSYFKLNAADLIAACESKPLNFKHLTIDVVGSQREVDELEARWTVDCDVNLMRRVIEVYKAAGVVVKGTASDAVWMEDYSAGN